MGSRTYETAMGFVAKGFGWSYGDKPTFVLTSRELPRIRATVELCSGDLAQLVNERLRPRFRSIWFAGGGAVSGECLRRGLADEIRYSVLPIVIGDGIPFFEKLERDVALHLAEVALGAAPGHAGALDASLAAHRVLLRASVNFWETRWLEAQIRTLERRRASA